MSKNRITVSVPAQGYSTTLKTVSFAVVDGEGDAIVQGEVFLKTLNGHNDAVLMSSDMADELLQEYVLKMGITPEMVQEFIDHAKVRTAMLAQGLDMVPLSEVPSLFGFEKTSNQGDSDGNYCEPEKQTGRLYGDTDARE